MLEQTAPERTPANGAANETADKPPRNRPRAGREVSDPRDVATLIMARMAIIHSKKDELTIAIKGLSDVTQQLSLAYGQQLQSIERLSQRVKALEATASAAASAWGDRPPTA